MSSFTCYFSPSTKGFYIKDLHTDIPDDVVSVSEALWVELTMSHDPQSVLDVDQNGKPFRTAPSEESILAGRAVSMRNVRSRILSKTDGIVERHRDQNELGGLTSLTTEQYHQMLIYRQQLRDLPAVPGFPNVELPTPPDFLILD